MFLLNNIVFLDDIKGRLLIMLWIFYYILVYYKVFNVY